MTEKTIYIAADGTQFDDKEICYEYEMMYADKGVMLFDSCWKKLDLHFESTYMIAKYLIVNDNYEDIWNNILENLSQNDSIHHMPLHSGKYYFDVETKRWINLDSKLDLLNYIKNNMEEFERGIRKSCE